MTQHAIAAPDIRWKKGKKVSSAAIIISAVILLVGIVAFALQAPHPEFDKQYDQYHAEQAALKASQAKTYLDSLVMRNAEEKNAYASLGAQPGEADDALTALENALENVQATSESVTRLVDNAKNTPNYASFFMTLARYRTPIIIAGAAILIISLLFFVAYNKDSKICLSIVRDKWLYILLVPGLVYFVIFKYLPMWGVVIAFQEYVPYSGIFASEWVGFDQFIRFFNTPMLGKLFANTLILSFMNLALYFPAPIFLSLLLNEMRNQRYKKLVQTFLYVPHFISIVIVVSITYVIFDSEGIIGRLAVSLFGKKIDFLTDPKVFRWMIVGQSIWKEMGWGTIIFLAALTNVDVQLYEAAMVDGAGRMRQMWHITLPAIRSTIVLLLILRMGSVLDTGYDHLILMSNAMNREVSQTFDVFVYEQGINSADYSYATAVGLFKSVISVTLVVLSNKIAHALGEPGLY